MNLAPATVRSFANLRPDQTMTAQGTVILDGASGYHQFCGVSGRWAVGRNEFGQIVVQIQVLPRNYMSFSIFAGITTDPKTLYSRIPDHTAGGYVETACKRSLRQLTSRPLAGYPEQNT